MFIFRRKYFGNPRWLGSPAALVAASSSKYIRVSLGDYVFELLRAELVITQLRVDPNGSECVSRVFFYEPGSNRIVEENASLKYSQLKK